MGSFRGGIGVGPVEGRGLDQMGSSISNVSVRTKAAVTVERLLADVAVAEPEDAMEKDVRVQM